MRLDAMGRDILANDVTSLYSESQRTTGYRLSPCRKHHCRNFTLKQPVQSGGAGCRISRRRALTGWRIDFDLHVGSLKQCLVTLLPDDIGVDVSQE